MAIPSSVGRPCVPDVTDVAKMFLVPLKTPRKPQLALLCRLTPSRRFPGSFTASAPVPAVSPQLYGGRTLNLGFTQQDARAAVEKNRERFLQQLGATGKGRPWPLVTLRQIHLRPYRSRPCASENDIRKISTCRRRPHHATARSAAGDSDRRLPARYPGGRKLERCRRLPRGLGVGPSNALSRRVSARCTVTSALCPAT